MSFYVFCVLPYTVFILSLAQAWGLLYHGIDFAGGCARKRFTSCFTTSNLQFYVKHGMFHIETTHVHLLHFTMSATIQCIQRYIMHALLNGRLKLVVMVGLLQG